ncbi:MAG: hypothetical protein JF595_03695 [Sphingomonadales bacterium]|nr:hypothetical protein [Sphingomonadales bacterium]
MTALSHSFAGLSMRVLLGLGLVASAGGALAAGNRAAVSSPYYGRWTESEDRPIFTARGRLYKTIDVAPCGRDFCGVSVDDRGQCGATLFRFLSRHANGTYELRGHGKWGDAQKNLEIYSDDDTGAAGDRSFDLYVGDGHDFGGRSESMPKFHATYRRLGGGSCRAR